MRPRPRTLLQVLVAALALLLADRIAVALAIERAAGVLCLTSLAALVITARLGWRQAALATAGLALLAIPAVLAQGQPLQATPVMVAAALALGLSARWQLQPLLWLMVVSLGLLITNSPIPAAAGGAVLRLAGALLIAGGLATLLQSWMAPGAAEAGGADAGAPEPPADAATPGIPVRHSWRRSAAYGLLLAFTTLLTTPIALQNHWQISGLWLILTPFLVLRPFVRDAWRVAVHRSLGTVAGVLLVLLLALRLPQALPLQIPAILAALIAAMVAIRRGHPALMLMALTVAVVLFNSTHADLLQMADERLQASGLGVAITLVVMALAHPIERRLAGALPPQPRAPAP